MGWLIPGTNGVVWATPSVLSLGPLSPPSFSRIGHTLELKGLYSKMVTFLQMNRCPNKALRYLRIDF